MQKILRSPASMRRKVNNKIFGVPLKELCRANPSGGVKIPDVLHKIVEFISMHGIGHEGIFRINGSTKVIDKMKLQFDRHGSASLEEAGDVMAVASLLKLFFRELPEPIIVSQLHTQFLTIQEEFQYNKEESLKQLKNLLQQLPEEHFLVLRYLCRFLRKVTHYEDTNKMNSMALAIVFGPNLFRCAEGIQGLREQGQTNHLVRLFIEKFDFLLGPDGGDSGSGYSPPSSNVALYGQGQVWNSKRIEVQAAKEKRSPSLAPTPYDQYVKMRRAKQASQEEVDLNSNYSDPSKDDTSSGSPQTQGYLSTPDADFDERALSPFNLDSELGTSAAPSPVASVVTSEVVERTIQESISQHLFGTHGSPLKPTSPRQQESPVAMPRKKHQKKGQDGSTSFNRRSNSESSLERLVSSFEDQEGVSVKSRVQQFSDDTLVASRSHDKAQPMRRKGRPGSKAFDLFESQGIIIGQKSMDSLVSSGRSREDSLTDVTKDNASDLDTVRRNSGPLHSLTAGRASPPKRRSPSKKKLRDTSDTQSPESPVSREKAAKKTNQNELKPPGMDVWLRQNGEGRRSPTAGRNVRDGGLWGIQPSPESPQDKEPPIPHPRQRRRKAREEDDWEEEEEGDGERETDMRRGRGMMPSAGSHGNGNRRKTGADEDGERPKPAASKGLGEERRREGDGRMGEERMYGEGKENLCSSDLRGQLVPRLDFASLHVNTEGHDAVRAWSSKQDGRAGGGEADEGSEKESKTQGGSQTLSRLEKLQTITSLLHDPYDAPLSPRAKDAPPTFGSGSWDTLDGPPSPVSQHDLFPRSSKHSAGSRDTDDQVAVIKQLTRQVRSLKLKIRQYEDDFESQYHAKPSQTEKLSQPEIRKMIGELKRATKQLKALKSEAKDLKSPLHSTLPARLSGGELEEGGSGRGSGGGLSPVHLTGLKESLNLAQKRLQEKRTEARRAFNIQEMSQDEVREEKVAIQKALLQLESKYGRPTSRSSKEVMKPLYDRYRTLKKLLKTKELRRSISEDVNPSDLNTIEEHVETREFMPKLMGFVHSKYDQDEMEDDPDDDMFGTSDFRVTQMVSPAGQRSGGRSPASRDDVCLSPNDSGRNDSPFSPSSSSFHEATLEELLTRQEQAQNEKRRLRRVLKDFEENFRQETGQRVEKEDRSPMELEYNQYKHIKKQLKLLNALIAKHQSQTMAVT